jgi:hypothetical protein
VVLDGYAGSWFIVDSSRRLRWSTTAKDEERLVAMDKEHSEQTDSEERASKEVSSEGEASGVPRWLVVTVALALTIVAIVIVYGYLARPKPEWIGVANKNVWDWLALLVVPAALAMGVYWLNTRQAARQQREADRRQASEEATQEAQEQHARALEDQRGQDAALQAYLDQMSQLLTDEKRPLRRAQPSDDLSIVARARTLTVLPRLDGARKASVVQFLYESGLIYRDRAVLDLSGADLREARLFPADLFKADLSGAYLNRADLSGTDLRGANLYSAYLSDSHYSKPHVIETNMSVVHMGAREANLSDADLRWANLSGVRGWTEGQLSSAVSLEGATMPNVQKYEDWLKDREGRGEDGENNGPS